MITVQACLLGNGCISASALIVLFGSVWQVRPRCGDVEKKTLLSVICQSLLDCCQSFFQVLNLFALQDMVDNVVADQPFQPAIVCVQKAG
jgi:hypothetical protein